MRRAVEPCIYITDNGNLRVTYETSRNGVRTSHGVGTFSSIAEARQALIFHRAGNLEVFKPGNYETLEALLRDAYRYDPTTGDIIRTKSVSPRRRGQGVGQVRATQGYRVVYVKYGGRQHTLYAHRLAFFFMEGRWPEGIIDHMNGSRDDNRWCNLRHVTVEQNLANTSRGRCRTVVTISGRFFPIFTEGFETREEAERYRSETLAMLALF